MDAIKTRELPNPRRENFPILSPYAERKICWHLPLSGREQAIEANSSRTPLGIGEHSGPT